MANYANLKAAINAVITANGAQEITGEVLNQTLTSIVNSLGAGYQFMGIATPSTNPATPDQNVFYLAGQAGTYTNFNNITILDGVSVLKYNGSWTSEVVMYGSGVFDISAYKAVGGTLATYADLAAALNSGNNVPESIRKGGMSVKFVQSSDNKYVQYLLTKNTFSSKETDWQKINIEQFVESNSIIRNNVFFNKALDRDGTLYDAVGWFVTDFIEASGSITVEVDFGTHPQQTHFVVAFNENKQAINYWSNNTGSYRNDIVTPASTQYLRFSFCYNGSDRYYAKNANTGIDIYNESINPIQAFLQNELHKGLTTFISGYSLDRYGNILEDEDCFITPFLEYPAGAYILDWDSGFPSSLTDGKHCLISYDENLNVVDYNNPNPSHRTDITPPSTTKYIRATFYKGTTPSLTDNNGNNLLVSTLKSVGNSVPVDEKKLLDIENIVNQNLYKIPFNYIKDHYLNNTSSLIFRTGLNVSERIPVKEKIFTWNFGDGNYFYQSAELHIYDAQMNRLDNFGPPPSNTGYSRTIDISNESWADDAAFIIFSFAKGGSLVQGAETWTPSDFYKQNQRIENIKVTTYNVNAYRCEASYMSQAQQEEYLREFKLFMNGKINNDIMLTQEDAITYNNGVDSFDVYTKLYRQFYPYHYVTRKDWSGIYSKYPLKNCREFDYSYISSGTTYHRYHAIAEVEICGITIGIASVHCNFVSESQQKDEFNAIINEMKDYDYVIIGGDFNVDIQASEVGNCPAINETFGMAGYKTANWGYWGNIHTQTDMNQQMEPTRENQIDSFVVKGFDINSFDVLPVEFYDHMPCVSKLNFSVF